MDEPSLCYLCWCYWNCSILKTIRSPKWSTWDDTEYGKDFVLLNKKPKLPKSFFFHSFLFKSVGKHILGSEKKKKKKGFFFSVLPHQEQSLQEDTSSCVPSPAKTKVLSAANLMASSKLSRLKDLIRVYACSFPTRAYGNQGRRRKAVAELDAVPGHVPVTQLWEMSPGLTVELVLKYRVTCCVGEALAELS